jgi:hypothetical protein
MKIRVESAPVRSIRGGARAAAADISPGEYFHSERALFCVERCDYGRALVENCRTGELLDVAAEYLLRLHRVER